MGKVERGKELTEQVDSFIGELSEQLSQGQTADFLDTLRFYADNFHGYTITNMKLIRHQRPIASKCAGYNHWSELGCQVRKGEKGLWIRAPWIRKELDQETGEKTERLIGYIGVAVYDISQVDGAENLPQYRRPVEGDYADIYQTLCASAREHGIEVEEVQLSTVLQGSSYIGKVIVNRLAPDHDKLLVLCHELAHELLHTAEDRLDDSMQRQRELEAEATSYCLGRLVGIDNDFSRNYIINWRGTVEGLSQSLTRIHRAVKTIHGWMEVKESEPAIAA